MFETIGRALHDHFSYDLPVALQFFGIENDFNLDDEYGREAAQDTLWLLVSEWPTDIRTTRHGIVVEFYDEPTLIFEDEDETRGRIFGGDFLSPVAARRLWFAFDLDQYTGYHENRNDE